MTDEVIDEQAIATEKDNVVGIHSKVEDIQPLTPDDILDKMKGLLEDVVVIGFNKEGSMMVFSSHPSMHWTMGTLELGKNFYVQELLGDRIGDIE